MRTIGVSDRPEPSADERDALWELAELDTANEDVRRMVINQWVENDDIDLLTRPLRNDFRGLHAAIGLNAALTTYWGSRANDALGHLAKALESTPQTDSYRLSSLGETLSALAARMNPDAAAPLADRLAKALESTPQTDSYRLSSLGKTLSALATRMNPDAAALLADRLAKALESTPQTDSYRLSSLGETLLALAAPFPQESSTLLQALSNMSLQRILNPQEKGPEEPSMRKTFQTGCAQLRPRDLAEVLKWPFCVGEAQKLVFAELEKKIKEKTGRTFGGDVWKFVEQVDSLRIDGLDRKFLDQPAKRPKAEDALKEIEAIRAKLEKKPLSTTPSSSP